MSNITILATGKINAVNTLTIELVEADETPAVVIVRWPSTARRTVGGATAVRGGRPG
jgi:hypothetical protein